MKHFLLAYDGSDHALKAVNELLKLAKAFPEARITVLFVVDYDQSTEDALNLSIDFQKQEEERRETIRRELYVLNNADLSYTVDILHGVPADEILRYAKEHAADLIIMGSRGMNSIKKLFVGSVSQKIIDHSECPVYVVK